MELCESSLDKRLAEGMSFQYEEVFDFIRQILMALCLLHRNNLVHLDIKVRSSSGSSSSNSGGGSGGSRKKEKDGIAYF